MVHGLSPVLGVCRRCWPVHAPLTVRQYKGACVHFTLVLKALRGERSQASAKTTEPRSEIPALLADSQHQRR